MKQLWTIVLMMSIGAVAPIAYADICHVNSERAFNTVLAENKHAAVLFYDGRYPDESVRRFKKNSIKEYFQQSGLRFYAVDTRVLPNVADDYDVEPRESALLLFRRGAPIRNMRNEIVMLTGIESSENIESFIHQYLGEHLERELRKIRRQERSHVRVVEQVYYKPEPRVSFGFGFGSPAVACCPAPCYYDCAPMSSFGFSIGL